MERWPLTHILYVGQQRLRGGEERWDGVVPQGRGKQLLLRWIWQGRYIVWEERDQHGSHQGWGEMWPHNPRHGFLSPAELQDESSCKPKRRTGSKRLLQNLTGYSFILARDIPIRANIGQFSCQLPTSSIISNPSVLWLAQRDFHTSLP